MTMTTQENINPGHGLGSPEVGFGASMNLARGFRNAKVVKKTPKEAMMRLVCVS